MYELNLLESIEKYLRGEMLPDEKQAFEQLRSSDPRIDQTVVEHSLFLQQMENFSDRKNLKVTLQDLHNELLEAGSIRQTQETKVRRLWLKYRKTVSVAAIIAGVTALGITTLSIFLAPKNDRSAQLLSLSRKISLLEQRQKSLNDKLNETRTKAPAEAEVKLGGTGFMLDTRGYLVTNAHVVMNATAVIVQNSRGQEFKTKTVYLNSASDLAILKITDSDFKALPNIPYGINKNGLDLGEPIFTLGYPREEIVYGEGYLSAKTGFRGDTLACQIAVAANPGNSGGPVLDRNGEVIGVLSNRQVQAQGAVFAIRSQNIAAAVEEMRSDTANNTIHLPQSSSLRNMDRIQQIKKIQDFIYLVKSY